jgi:hypothetical protein
MENALVISNADIGLGFDLVLGTWNNRLDCFRQYEHNVRETLEGGLGFSLSYIEHMKGGGDWLASIPNEYLAVTQPYQEYQFQMLWLLANSEEAVDIVRSRPILLAMLCKAYPLNNNKALEALKGGQRHILKHIGLNASKGALRFLGKLEPDAQTTNGLNYVIQKLEPTFSRFMAFKHYKRVNLSSLSLDHSYPFITGTTLGLALAHEQDGVRQRLAFYLRDTLELGQAIGIADPARSVVARKSLDSLRELHDEWAVRRIDQDLVASTPEDANLPYPLLFKETENIKQITHYEMLCDEAREQQHCVAIYHSRIVRGRYAVFRMLEPERMTIGVAISPGVDCHFRLEQISGYKNQLPEEETRALVYQWFEECKSALKSKPSTTNR